MISLPWIHLFLLLLGEAAIRILPGAVSPLLPTRTLIYHISVKHSSGEKSNSDTSLHTACLSQCLSQCTLLVSHSVSQQNGVSAQSLGSGMWAVPQWVEGARTIYAD